LHRFKEARAANSHHYAPPVLIKFKCHEIVRFGAKDGKCLTERPKISGRVAYAVMSFGGSLGMGTEEHAVPWSKLT
jgi:hypothetical protein